MENKVTTGASAAILLQMVDLFGPLKYLIFLAFVLIVADLRWGIAAARKRREEIRWSRAVRRTINKFIDYILWIMIAALLGKGFGTVFNVPIITFIVLLIVYTIELSSICGHYFYIKDIKKRIDFWGIFKKYKIIKDI